MCIRDSGGGSAGDGGGAYNVGDIVHFGEADGSQYEVTGISTDNLTIRQLDNPNGGGLKTALVAATNVRRRWKFYDLFDAAQGTSKWAASKGMTADEMNVVVHDVTGGISSYDSDVAGQRTLAVLETYAFVSQASGSKTPQGGTNFYANKINTASRNVWWMDHDSSLTAAGTDIASGATYASTQTHAGVINSLLTGGTDDNPTVGELDIAYNLFADSDTVDVNLVMAGTAPAGTDGVTHATNIIDLCEARKDVVGFISPRRADVVGVSTGAAQTNNVKGFFD